MRILGPSILPIVLLACSSAAPSAPDEAAAPVLSNPSSPSASASANATSTATTPPAGSPWSSPETCEALVTAGRRASHGSAPRLVSWNLHWFPDGVMPSSGDPPRPANLAWLACTIAWLDVDVLEVEEMTKNARAEAALSELLGRLNVLTHGDWKAELDRCPHPDAQHQGFLYDAHRATLEGAHTFDWRSGDWCNLSVRPGLSAHVKLAGGRDFHMVAVHAKSGVDARSYDLRQTALAALPELLADAQSHAADPDVIVAGDFNTMGCTDAAHGKVDADAEIATLGAQATAAGFTRVPSDATCSEYAWSTNHHLLDHFLVAHAATAPESHVDGYCAELACNAFSSDPRARRELSDHCPVVLELR